MKRMTIVVLMGLFLLSAFAEAQMRGGMMGGYYGSGDEDQGYGYRYGMMGPGYGYGMMGPGMMGPGYGGALSDPQTIKFLDETRDLRKSMHMKMFEYQEAARTPGTPKETIEKLQSEMNDLMGKIYEKARSIK